MDQDVRTAPAATEGGFGAVEVADRPATLGPPVGAATPTYGEPVRDAGPPRSFPLADGDPRVPPRRPTDRPPPSTPAPETLAGTLGVASFVLGLPALVAPATVASVVGVEATAGTTAVLRAVGARELVTGVGIATSPRPAPWLWARVAGDVMDLALLANALRTGPREVPRTLGTIAAVAGITAIDVHAARDNGRARAAAPDSGILEATAVTTVNRGADEVYRAWRNLEGLPRFMTHLVSVEDTGAGRSRWVAAAPAGRQVSWEAEILEDVPGRRLAWRAVDGSTVPNRGAVTFTPIRGGRSTEVLVELAYVPPAGAIGHLVAQLLGEEPRQQIRDDLRRFKQMVETGAIVRSDGSPDGTEHANLRRQRPAQPLNGKDER